MAYAFSPNPADIPWVTRETTAESRIPKPIEGKRIRHHTRRAQQLPRTPKPVISGMIKP